MDPHKTGESNLFYEGSPGNTHSRVTFTFPITMRESKTVGLKQHVSTVVSRRKLLVLVTNKGLPENNAGILIVKFIIGGRKVPGRRLRRVSSSAACISSSAYSKHNSALKALRGLFFCMITSIRTATVPVVVPHLYIDKITLLWKWS